MREPPVPENEGERLETLRSLNLLDTPPDERFDRLTRLARRMFDVPVALITLVDEERQWFKSCVGLDMSETGRNVSFCAHAIVSDEVLIVPDASLDERFRDNPLVRDEPGIQFYAGCPVRAPEGHRLGTFCIIDNRPRTLAEDDIECLRDFARIAEDEIAALELAATDDLTGLSNRRGFLLSAGQAMSLCVRERLPVSLVFVDLNGLKSINDTYGHAEGDRAIMIVAETLGEAFRESDVVARLGGDEFVVLLTDAGEGEAHHIMARAEERMEKCKADREIPVMPSIAYGVVTLDSKRHESVVDLLDEADARMYENKSASKG